VNADIVIVANKWWEVAPLIAAVQNPDAIPATFAPASVAGASGPAGPHPRLVTHCSGRSLEVWCIQDFMDPSLSESLTWEKARVLPRILGGPVTPRLVIGLGTAACPAGSGNNGSVVVGSSVFVHDPYAEPRPDSHPPDPAMHWRHDELDRVIPSSAEPLLAHVGSDVRGEVEKRLLRPPSGAASPPQMSVGPNLVGLGVVNVTDYHDYTWTDDEAMKRFAALGTDGVAASLETTHGVIRLVLDRPFVFVSGFANAVGKYGDEVSPRKYAQNLAAANNAAVAAAWMVHALAPHL
jgi:hypothetical protein